MPLALDIGLAIWLLMVGACIGSFLNVVILRVPAGETIVHGGSHCPKCLHAIRWFDNIPVISWLLLGGKCRDCGLPISARYPLIELIVGMLFAILGWFEPLARGANLPERLMAGETPVLDERLLWILYAYQLVFLTTLVAVAVIQLDRHRVPFAVMLPAIGVGLLTPAWQPLVHPLPMVLMSGSWARMSMSDALIGLVAGAVLCWPIGRAGSAASELADCRAVVLSGALTGLFLGWYLALLVVATTVIVQLGCRLSVWLIRKPLRIPFSVFLTGATMVAIIGWKQIDQHAFGAGSRLLWPSVLVAGGGWLLAVLVTRILSIKGA